MVRGKVKPEMKWAFIISIFLWVTFLFLIFGNNGHSDSPTEEERIQYLAKEIQISTIQLSPVLQKGTGFYIDSNTILTSNHVIKNSGSEVPFTSNEGQSCKANVGYREEGWDLAILTTDCTGRSIPQSGKNPAVGTKVVALGYPDVFGYLVSSGVVSGWWNSYMMLDASINSGNSGGPVVNLRGELVGVVTSTAKNAQGIGAAVSVEDIQMFLRRAGH